MFEVLKVLAVVFSLFKLLGLWGSLALVGVIVAAFLALRTFGDRIMEGLVAHHIQALGKPLADATLAIRSITAAPEPDPSVFRTGDDEEDDAFEADLEASGMPEGEYEWYKIDAEISPKPDPEGNPVGWDPGMIQIRKDDGQRRRALEIDIDCLIAQTELWQDGEFVAREYDHATGSARIRLYVGVTPGTRDIEFFYMGEPLGHTQLPTGPRIPA
jgi:hypothetical protein